MTQRKRAPKVNVRILLIVCGSVIAGLVILAEIFMIGNVGYLLRWHECGRQPVVVRSVGPFLRDANTPEVIEVVTHPNFFDSKKPLLADPETTEIMCSLSEARQKYQHNPAIDSYYER